MSERPARRTVSLPAPAEGSGFDELNLARLALVSGQKTVPANQQRWQKQITTPDGRPVVITCTVPEGLVVPHGLDNDFMVGLVNLCFEAGLPDGPFSVTAYALLKASGFPDTAQYYRALEESVLRLNKASYTIDEGWFQRGTHQWTTQSFAQVSYLSYTRSRSGVRGTSLVTVQLAPPVMESLRAGYIKPLDLEFYRNLSQPLVRALYRQLDALHFDDSTADGLAREVSAPLMGWASRLGLMTDRPDNVVRTLKPAHEELLAKRYVDSVEITGRGKDKEVRYVFGPAPEGEHPELAALLQARGVKKGVALRLSTVFPDRVEAAARRFDSYVQLTPIRNPGGLLVTMIQRPEDFGGPDAPPPVPPPTPRRGAAARIPGPAEEDVPEDRRAAGLEGQALLDWTLRQLGVIGVIKHFPVADRAALGEAVLAGRLDGRDVVRVFRRALAGGLPAILEAVTDLRKHF